MFSEMRYALNGDLRVAYRASREGSRDIVYVPNWFTCCEMLPEQPSIQGWVEAMTSVGRLIFFDQPGTGASDPVTPGALPNLEQWADSVTAVLDDLGSREAVLVASDAAFAPAALFAATHPSRTTALVVLVSSTLRDLVIGSGLEFEDRGPHELKGVPGDWRLFAVASG
jgi:pimeloyl-ACP methyl ester carboxylesterase